MTQRRMEKIVKRRKVSQGIGALGGALTVFAVLGAIYGEDMKKEAGKLAAEVQEKDLKRITSEYGAQLRMNRSIQAEGSFADVKEDMNFRRYLYRGKKNALAESIILAMGRNISKLHFRIQSGRTGLHLFDLKSA